MTLMTDFRPIIRTGSPLLHRAEAWLIGAVVATGIAALALSDARDQMVDWAGFAMGLAPSCVLVGVGLFARARQSFDRLSLLMIAGGIFIGFVTVSAIFTFLQFPFARLPVDRTLIAIDGSLGYSWIALVMAVADHPWIGHALRLVYITSIWQLLAVMTMLAWLGRRVEVHRFLAVGIAGLALTVAVWAIFPSIGAASVFAIPADIAARIDLGETSAYGEMLRHYSVQGLPMITPDSITGVISFPSFHTIMAAMAVWFARRTPLAVPAILLNLPMVPAILLHGSHHLVDLIGGVVIFTLVTWAATRLIRDP